MHHQNKKEKESKKVQSESKGSGRSGFVYVLSNPAMPGLLKIGKTKDIEQRIRVLNKETGTPFPFKIEFKIYVENAQELELLIHAALHNKRVDVMKEFFHVDQAIVIKKLREWATKLQNDPYYFNKRFPNFGQSWNEDLAKQAIEHYDTSNDLLQTSFQMGKTPYELETFLNKIGVISTTHFPNSLPSHKGFNANYYKNICKKTSFKKRVTF